MADEYHTSQANLRYNNNGERPDEDTLEPETGERRAQMQMQEQEQPRHLLNDEMSQDLNYLSREAPLDGGESTFGAYSQLGGSSLHNLAESPTPLDQLAPDNVDIQRPPVQQAG